MKNKPHGQPDGSGFRILAADRSWPGSAPDPKPTVHAAWRFCSRVRGERPGPESDFQRHPAFRPCLDAIVAGVRKSVLLPLPLCGAFLTNQRDQRAFVDRHGPAQFEDSGPFVGIAREGFLYFYWWDGRVCHVLASALPAPVVTVETSGSPYARWLATELHRLGIVADLPPPPPFPDPSVVVPPGGFAVIAPRLLAREADPAPSLDSAAKAEIGAFLSGLSRAKEPLRTYVDTGIAGAYEAFDPMVRRANRVTEEAYLDPAKYPDREGAIQSQRVQQWQNLVVWLRRSPARHRAVLVLRPDLARLPMADILDVWRRAAPDLSMADSALPPEAGVADTVTVFDPCRPSGSRWTVLSL